jgi:hypothetical protein
MESYRPGLRAWLALAGIVIAVVLVLRGVRAMQPPDPRIELRDSLAVLRMRTESCQRDVRADAAWLRAYDARLDSMRGRVRELEALDRRGVPVDSYTVYMGAFETYNDSVAAWAPLEDSVRAADARCREVALRHNALADSLRALVAQSRD